jgi:pimeloyl-ACP methyl ester carboxylesterase
MTPVVLLHGGFMAAESWAPQVAALSPAYEVHTPERPGHGATPDVPGPYSYEDGVARTLAHLDQHGIDRAHLVGFSDGAVIGLLLAAQHPERVRSLTAIGATLSPAAYDGDDRPDRSGVAEAWPEVRATYDRLSPDGPAHGEAVLEKLSAMWSDYGPVDPSPITAPTLVMAGDRDSAPPQHALLIARSIPDAQLCLLPDTGHLAPVEEPDLVNAVLARFLVQVGEGR